MFLLSIFFFAGFYSVDYKNSPGRFVLVWLTVFVLMFLLMLLALLDLLLTARLIDAAEAARLGLVNRLVPRDELMGWAIETAEMIAANSPSAVQAVKRQVSATVADHALTREALEQQLGDEVRASPHFAEGIAAFREKRLPRYE